VIPAVLFDLDDTLIESTRAIRIAARVATEAIGDLAGDELDDACATWWVDPGGFFAAYGRGELSFDQQREARLVRVCADHGLPELDSTGRATWLDRYTRALVDNARSYQDVVPCLAALSGRPLGIVTNVATDGQRAKLRSAGLEMWFDVVLGPDLFGARKPDPAGFLAGCAALGVDVAAAVYVGDNLDLDARGAAAAGLRGIWLDRRRRAPVEDVERIESLAELPGLLGMSSDRQR